jgi:hypothetical protein
MARASHASQIHASARSPRARRARLARCRKAALLYLLLFGVGTITGMLLITALLG